MDFLKNRFPNIEIQTALYGVKERLYFFNLFAINMNFDMCYSILVAKSTLFDMFCTVIFDLDDRSLV